MLKPSVVKATRSVSRREGRSNPPDLSDEFKGEIPCSYPTIFKFHKALFFEVVLHSDDVLIICKFVV